MDVGEAGACFTAAGTRGAMELGKETKQVMACPVTSGTTKGEKILPLFMATVPWTSTEVKDGDKRR